MKNHKSCNYMKMGLSENLSGKKKLFIDLHGNSMAPVLTKKSALNFSKWLKEASVFVKQIAYKIEK